MSSLEKILMPFQDVICQGKKKIKSDPVGPSVALIMPFTNRSQPITAGCIAPSSCVFFQGLDVAERQLHAVRAIRNLQRAAKLPVTLNANAPLQLKCFKASYQHYKLVRDQNLSPL